MTIFDFSQMWFFKPPAIKDNSLKKQRIESVLFLPGPGPWCWSEWQPLNPKGLHIVYMKYPDRVQTGFWVGSTARLLVSYSFTMLPRNPSTASKKLLWMVKVCPEPESSVQTWSRACQGSGQYWLPLNRADVCIKLWQYVHIDTKGA